MQNLWTISKKAFVQHIKEESLPVTSKSYYNQTFGLRENFYQDEIIFIFIRFLCFSFVLFFIAFNFFCWKLWIVLSNVRLSSVFGGNGNLNRSGSSEFPLKFCSGHFSYHFRAASFLYVQCAFLLIYWIIYFVRLAAI